MPNLFNLCILLKTQTFLPVKFKLCASGKVTSGRKKKDTMLDRKTQWYIVVCTYSSLEYRVEKEGGWTREPGKCDYADRISVATGNTMFLSHAGYNIRIVGSQLHRREDREGEREKVEGEGSLSYGKGYIWSIRPIYHPSSHIPQLPTWFTPRYGTCPVALSETWYSAINFTVENPAWYIYTRGYCICRDIHTYMYIALSSRYPFTGEWLREKERRKENWDGQHRNWQSDRHVRRSLTTVDLD